MVLKSPWRKGTHSKHNVTEFMKDTKDTRVLSAGLAWDKVVGAILNISLVF